MSKVVRRVLLAAALVVAGVATNLPSGVEAATAVIDDGRAAHVLETFVKVSQQAAAEDATG